MKARMDTPALSVPGAFEALQALGECHRGAACRLLTRGLAGGADDPRRSAAQGADVGHVAGDLAELVGDEEVEVPGHPLHHLLAFGRRRCPLHLLAILRSAFFDHGPEPPHCGEDTRAAVRLGDILERGPPPRRVGQELEDRRLVCDERANPIGMSRDELEADRATAAVAVHVRRLVADGREDRRRVVRVQRHRDVFGITLERAPRVASLVVADDRVPVCQLACEVGEHARVGGTTRDAKEKRARAPHLVVERRARHRQRLLLLLFRCRRAHLHPPVASYGFGGCAEPVTVLPSGLFSTC